REWPRGQARLDRPNRLRQEAPSGTAPSRGGDGAPAPLLGWPVSGPTMEPASLPTTLLVSTICPSRASRHQGREDSPVYCPRLPLRNTLAPRLPRVKLGKTGKKPGGGLPDRDPLGPGSSRGLAPRRPAGVAAGSASSRWASPCPWSPAQPGAEAGEETGRRLAGVRRLIPRKFYASGAWLGKRRRR